MKAMITLPEPCSENWEAMTPNEQGRHCALCCHTVIDFSTWELPEIAAYLESRKGEKVCGRFNSTQLNKPFDLKILVPEIVRWYAPAFRKIAALIIVCFALGSASCTTTEPDPGTVVGEMMPASSLTVFDSVDAAQKRQGEVIKIKPEEPTDKGSVTGVKPIAKGHRKARKHTPVFVEGEAGRPMGGPPVMVYPREPVVTAPPKYRPKMGPPEEDVE